jgi:catechol 2,3-dioxygenase-like lactoylglutathione lyase family enzyme
MIKQEMRMAKPDMIGMVVRDMGAALRFYRSLGLEIPAGKESEDHVEIVMPNGLRIAWDSLEMIKSIYPDWVVPAAGQRMTLAFLCDNPAEVDALYDRVVQNGYRGAKAPWDAFWGQRYAVVADPDGNLVDLFAGL